MAWPYAELNRCSWNATPTLPVVLVFKAIKNHRASQHGW